MKGRVLKIKLGYNPNSSGYAITIFFLVAGAAAMITNTVLSIIVSRVLCNKARDSSRSDT